MLRSFCSGCRERHLIASRDIINNERLKLINMNFEKIKISIIGQGYVGLPLAIEFGKKYTTIGFDINQNRIDSWFYLYTYSISTCRI